MRVDAAATSTVEIKFATLHQEIGAKEGDRPRQCQDTRQVSAQQASSVVRGRACAHRASVHLSRSPLTQQPTTSELSRVQAQCAGVPTAQPPVQPAAMHCNLDAPPRATAAQGRPCPCPPLSLTLFATASRGRLSPLSLSLSLSTPPMPGPQGCEKLVGPTGLLKFCTRAAFLALRWLQNQIYSNETGAH